MDRRLWIVLSCAAWIAAACGPGQPKQLGLSRIAAEAGLQVPPSKLLYEQNGLSDKSGLWILRSDERFVLPGDKEPVTPEDTRLELDRRLNARVVGELMDGLAIEHRWRKDDLRYRGTILRTSTGYFLRLERFAQP